MMWLGLDRKRDGRGNAAFAFFTLGCTVGLIALAIVIGLFVHAISVWPIECSDSMRIVSCYVRRLGVARKVDHARTHDTANF